MGEQSLKNIDVPVRVFDVMLDLPAASAECLLLDDSATSAKAKPSIAVLPFANMSGDPEQEYFADGITEDIITDLSKVSALSVIARNSVFTYKGKHADVQEVGRRFNVAYVLEGSVRKAGQRVRINAQLIDARDGTHLWADRYDRDLTDIFAIQDEITKTIVEQLKVKLLPQEKKAIEAAPTQNVEAYNYYLRGRHLYHLHTAAARAARTAHVQQGRGTRPGLCARLCRPRRLRLVPLQRPARRHDRRGHPCSRASRRSSWIPTWRRRTPPTAWRCTTWIATRKPLANSSEAIELNPNLYEAYYFYSFAARDRGDLVTALRHGGALRSDLARRLQGMD